ncbi:MAG TPA: hypothetical protein PKD53_25445 [Chloroflexaceae bacterium]|nr:hypothetical protein [Chloroflexaceae bacterium]
MPYSITRHGEHLLWVVMDGHLALHQAEGYFSEMWALLDEHPAPMDLLVDGRRIAGAAPGARRRTEQIAHHPRLGHLAFVVSEFHVLLFAPLVKLVSGVGLFGDEREALAYLGAARGTPGMANLALPNLPPPPGATNAHTSRHARGTRPAATRPLPPLPASRLKQTPIYPAGGGRAGAGDGEAE